MDFTLSAEQRQFAASLHDLLMAHDVPAIARSWAAGERKPGLEVWRSLAVAGATGLMIGPEYGGLGAGPVDLVIACEELGHHAVPGPVAESLAAVPHLLTAVSAGQQWLPQLAAGELIATLAAPPLVPLAADADVAGLVLVASPGSVCIAAAGQPLRSVDAARTLSEAAASEVIAAGREVANGLTRAQDFGTLACAAQVLGLARALLEATAVHARTRVQFGQPVGSFQVVKHYLADVLIGLEFARPLLFGAAVTLASGCADQAAVARDVSAAKVACTDAADRAAAAALQVHGAIGYTAEHDLSLYLTKVRALVPAWGSQAEHRARVLAALTGEGGAGRA